jgi:membrane associated rhomboid family serine protease
MGLFHFHPGTPFAFLPKKKMLLPIGDDNRDRHTTPYVNYIFLAINILVFIFLQDYGNNIYFTYAYSTVPAEILTGQDMVTDAVFTNPYTGDVERIPNLGRTDIPVHLTLLTSMFMHGGWAHLGGNMLYLWIFGDNLEHAMGHRRYFFFYLLCGALASLCHVFTTQYLGGNTLIPSLGASGAISGVLGGYLLLFPTRRVHVWVLLGIISVPAFVALGLWIVFQVVNGMGALGGQEEGGVAYAAHIGGFVAGLLLVKVFDRPKLRQKKGIFGEGRRYRTGW